jgi:hypothetical protein
VAAKITRDVLESFLHCKYKAHLKIRGQEGHKSDYEILLGFRERIGLAATAKLLLPLEEGAIVNVRLEKHQLLPGDQ